MNQKNGRSQYILTMVITFLALTLLVGYSFGSFYSVAKKDAVTIGEKTVAEESEKLNNFLLKGMDVLEVTSLVADYMLRNGSTTEEIEEFLFQESKDYSNKIDKHFTGIYGLFYGEYLDGSGWVPGPGYNPQERPWYQVALEGKGKPIVVSPYLDAKTNSIMISVSQLLSDGESVVSLDIVMDPMQDFAQDIQLNGNGYGLILDSKGLVVAHSNQSLKGKNYLTDADMKNTQKQKLAQDILAANGKTLNREIDGRECMVFSRIVQKDWYVIMVVDTDDVFHQVHMSLLRSVIISIIIFLMVGYFCTSAYLNRKKALQYAEELKEYQRTLEARVLEQTRKIKDQTQKMLQIQEDVIEGMAALIESRDAYTGRHVKNVKKYASMVIAYILKHQLYTEEVDEAYAERFRNAAALHDVGKILISDTILNKPDKLTDEEFEIMRSHTRLGEKIVKKVLGESADEQLVQMARHVVLYHHEKWNGKGYPDGLEGTEIPLCARIMAVADVFDALVTQRVYKEAMSMEKAMSILKELSGTQFDPAIVDIFFDIWDEVEAYQKEWRI
ncbi:MAG: HD domain-containing protein [Lachnospiraceae bacterium]|nr:HD domain-containing protein [Lachnospiraceae bacterium]